jgi:hypothetical protein
MGDQERPPPQSDDEVGQQIMVIDRMSALQPHSVTVSGRRYAQVLDELLSLRAALGIRRPPPPPPAPAAAANCPRCSDCPGQEHHWIEANDRNSSRYECKHCPAQCFAVDDLEDPLGGYKPSGLVIEVTAEMGAALDQVVSLIKRLGDDMPGVTSARWLFEEIGNAVDDKLDAIIDGAEGGGGEDDDPDLDYEPVDDEDPVS